MPRTRLIALTAVVALLASLPALPAEATVRSGSARTASARTMLAALPVRAEDHSKRYDRDLFGYDSDSDADGDGCSTRKEVLIRDALRLDEVSSSCAVSGQWRSLYDDRVTTNPYSLEVDHLVPIAEAWYSGARAWSHRKQVAYGNDVGYRWSLVAVTATVNQDKGAGDPADWLPAANRCTYVKAWIGVKYRWRLSVDTAEKRALIRQLERCASPVVEKPGTPDIGALAGSIPL